MEKLILLSVMLGGLAIVSQAQNEYWVTKTEMKTPRFDKNESQVFAGRIGFRIKKNKAIFNPLEDFTIPFNGVYERILEAVTDEYGVKRALYVQENDTIMVMYEDNKKLVLIFASSQTPDIYQTKYTLEKK